MYARRMNPYLWCAASSALLAIACSTPTEDGEPDPLARDCYADPASCIDDSGAHHDYVVDSVRLPASATEALQLGLDLDGDSDARPDNRLGAILVALASVSTGSLQTYFDDRIDDGSAILLADVQASGLASARDVGLRIRLGANASPPPCTDELDTACGHHLGGDAVIQIDTTSSFDVLAAGAIMGGRMSAGPIEVSFELDLDILAQPIALTLIGARTEAQVTDTGMTGGVVAGAVRRDQIVASVLPAVSQLAAADCQGAAPDCCTPESNGAALARLFDIDGDCVVSVAELETSDLLGVLLEPDVDMLDETGDYAPGVDGALDSISLGLGFTATTVRVP